MKVLFVSNDLTHHLVPFFESLLSIYGEDNCTFAVLKPDEYRQKMGFPMFNNVWVFAAYERTSEEYLGLWEDADIIITRIWDRLELIEHSLQKGKLVFYASERWFKPGIGKKRILVPSYFKRFVSFRKLSHYQNFFYLAMGYYASVDFRFMKLCKNCIFSFGYFTPPFTREFIQERRNNIVNILWAGRMLDWKRVIDLLTVFKDLESNYPIKLNLIGDGPKRNELINYAKNHNVRNVTFEKYVANKLLKDIMTKTDIYVLPSSGYEGWGAVINEAMQTKCAVIASKESGAARSMIIDGKNGLLYPSGNCNALKEALVKLLENPLLLNSLKEEGYKTITKTWSAAEAARRFSVIQSRISNGESHNYYKEGPMSVI